MTRRAPTNLTLWAKGEKGGWTKVKSPEFSSSLDCSSGSFHGGFWFLEDMQARPNQPGMSEASFYHGSLDDDIHGVAATFRVALVLLAASKSRP